MQQVTRFKITYMLFIWGTAAQCELSLQESYEKNEVGHSFTNFSFWGASSKGICYSRSAVIIEYSAQCPWGALCEDEIFSPAQWPVVRTCWLFQQAGPTITIDLWNHFSKHRRTTSDKNWWILHHTGVSMGALLLPISLPSTQRARINTWVPYRSPAQPQNEFP